MRTESKFLGILLCLATSSTWGDLGDSAQAALTAVPPPGGPSTFGDPIQNYDGSALYQETDLVIHDSSGDIPFTRTYSSNPGSLSFQQHLGVHGLGAPGPFGPNPYYEYGVDWWHNFFSYVVIRGSYHDDTGGLTPGNCIVRDTSGALTYFSTCNDDYGMPPTPTLFTTDTQQRPNEPRLWWDGAASFTLYKPGVGRYHYSAKHTYNCGYQQPDDQQSCDFYFLSSIEPTQYPVPSQMSTRVTLDYTGATPPYVQRVVTADGSELDFTYQNGVLSGLSLKGKSGQTTSVKSYSYTSGVLTGVHDNETGVDTTYNYGTPSQPVFSVLRGGMELIRKDFSGTVGGALLPMVDAQVDGMVPPTRDSSVTWLYGVPSPLGGGGTGTRRYFDLPTATLGDGTGRYVTSETNIWSSDDTNLTQSVTKACVGSLCPYSGYSTPGTGYWAMRYLVGAPSVPVEDYSETPLGRYSNNVWAVSSVSPFGELERTARFEGASGSSGNDALRKAWFTYDYGGVGQMLRVYEQLLTSKDEASAIPGQAMASTVYSWDTSTNRLKAIFRVGGAHSHPTGDNWSWATKTVGIFYFTRYACSGGQGDDHYMRTVEVHGPCFVSSTTATDCDLPGTAPVRQTFFYSDQLSTENANRVSMVSQWTSTSGTVPSGVTCTGPHLDTTYDQYDSRGRPQHVTDSNGTITDTSYTGEWLTQETVHGSSEARTTSLTYDPVTNRPRLVHYPDGNYEVFCYRINTTQGQGCVGGWYTDLLQWKARVPATAPLGQSWNDKIVYTYRNAKLSSEQHLDSAGSVRLYKYYEDDVAERPAWVTVGQADPFFLKKGYDLDNALVGLSDPYHSAASPHCGVGGDPNCTLLSNDRLSRPSAIIVTPDPSNPSVVNTTVIGYDAQGNVNSVGYGCDVSLSNCIQSSAYTWDDFGSLATTTASWLGSGSINYETDAAGNRLTEKSPQMLSGETLVYAYDSLSRLLAANRNYNGVLTLLYQYDYDSAPPGTPANCLPAAPNAAGRPVHRKDSFGDAWYQYDDFGQVNRVKRNRYGTGQCAASDSSTNVNPDSTYTHDSVGRLTAEKRPHGRTISYDYGLVSSGNEDRVAAIWAVWNGSNRKLVTNMLYEPYGGVFSYQGVPPNSSSTWIKAEYLPGTGVTVPQANACSPSLGSPDETGRVRLLQVSRGSSCDTGCPSWTPIYQRNYTWIGDQISEAASCVLNNSTGVKTELFHPSLGNGYDSALELSHAERPTHEFAYRAGAYYLRDYAYDRAGNRTTDWTDCYLYTSSYANGRIGQRTNAGPKQNTSECSSTAAAGANDMQEKFLYATNSDGRVATYQSQFYNKSPSTPALNIAFDTSIDGYGAVGQVYRAATVNGLRYDYYYDATGRRRMKVNPYGVSDEYFYDGTELVEDRGANSMTAEDPAPVDDYVWLDGRPVLMIRSQLQSGKNGPAIDSSSPTACARSTEGAQPCGVFFPVVDNVGKPLVLIDGSAKIAGVADYDPFGHVNRAYLSGHTQPGTAYRTGTQNLSTLTQTQASGLSQRIRGRFGLVDVATGYGAAKITNGSQSSALVSGQNSGPRITEWLTFSAPYTVQFTSTVANGRTGVMFDAFEYQRYESGSTPTWLPLRFFGHYYDSETDLFENWRRFYHPRSGRYFGPDPVTYSPTAARVYVYAYAGNNPLMNGDPNGQVNIGQAQSFVHKSETMAFDELARQSADTLDSFVGGFTDDPWGVLSGTKVLSDGTVSRQEWVVTFEIGADGPGLTLEPGTPRHGDSIGEGRGMVDFFCGPSCVGSLHIHPGSGETPEGLAKSISTQDVMNADAKAPNNYSYHEYVWSPKEVMDSALEPTLGGPLIRIEGGGSMHLSNATTAPTPPWSGAPPVSQPSRQVLYHAVSYP